MSAVEFGLTSQPSFLTLSQVQFEQPQTVREKRYEELLQLCGSIASMSPETLSENLIALVQPLFSCDFANIAIFDDSDSHTPWRSFGTDGLAALSIPLEESTLWSVYREQRPLWIPDCQHDLRSSVQREAQSAGVEYRSL